LKRLGVYYCEKIKNRPLFDLYKIFLLLDKNDDGYLTAKDVKKRNEIEFQKMKN
jgi:Ca2+-binding EF-hand superfamily protein